MLKKRVLALIVALSMLSGMFGAASAALSQADKAPSAAPMDGSMLPVC